MRDYTVRHAVYLTASVATGVACWLIFCIASALPFHPWMSVSLAILVGCTMFFFAGLDPIAIRLTNSLRSLYSFVLLICVGLAAAFTTQGDTFPIWALLPLILIGVALACVVSFFGLRSMAALLVGRPNHRLQLTGHARGYVHPGSASCPRAAGN
jgi:hypothetical protein